MNCCETCRYTNQDELKEYHCYNPTSWNYGYNTEFIDKCDDWEEKDVDS